MLEIIKVYHPDFPNNEFEQAIDLADISTVRKNGEVFDIVMKSAERLRMIRNGENFEHFIRRVNMAEASKNAR